MDTIFADPRHELLLPAAKNGDLTEITKLHAEGLDIDEFLGNEYLFHGYKTALSLAAKHGHIECVRKLLELGAGRDDIYGLMLKYKCALEMAAVNRHFECFRILVKNRLFRNVDDVSKYQEFIEASRREDFDHIQKLLVENNDKDILKGWKGNSLMNLFIVYGCPPSCLHVLIEQGGDINGYDYNGLTPLMCAVLTENLDCVSYLISLEADIDREQVYDPLYFLEDGTTRAENEANWGVTTLMYAACMSTECLRQVLQYYCDTNRDINFDENSRHWSALFYAAYFGNTESVSLFIKSGADMNRQDSFNYYFAPHYALLNGHANGLAVLLKVAAPNCIQSILSYYNLCVSNVQCLRVLLNYIEDLDRTNYEEMTYLMVAVNNNHLDSVRLLLEHGASVNFQNTLGITALMLSCDDQRIESLKLLIKQGANMDGQNKEGDTATMYAARNKAVKCVDELLAHGANIHLKNRKKETVVMIACASGHFEFVEALIKSGADVTAQSINKCTAVAYVSSVECLQLLIDQGADIYLKDKRRRTALMFSCELGHSEVVDFLIHNGLDVNAQDGDGKTAIMYAADNCHENCLKLLLKEGANLDLVGKRGSTVFSLAMVKDGNCLDLLLCSGKLFSNGVLKPHHKQAMLGIKNISKFSMKVLMLTMKFGIFDWDWCLSSHNLKTIALAAVKYGISPGKLNYKGLQISLFLLALIKTDTAIIKYLLANRYLFLQDIRALSTDNALQQFIKTQGALTIMEKLTAQPLSLQALSFLAISESISLGTGTVQSGRRDVMVEALPLPGKLKRALQFKGLLSGVCPSLWKSNGIGIERVLHEFNFIGEEMTLDENRDHHSAKCRDCS